MNDDKRNEDTASPDRYVERDVTDLRIEFGKIDEKLRSLKENAVTKEEFANWKLDAAKWIIQLAIPLLAVALGFALSQFFGK